MEVKSPAHLLGQRSCIESSYREQLKRLDQKIETLKKERLGKEKKLKDQNLFDLDVTVKTKVEQGESNLLGITKDCDCDHSESVCTPATCEYRDCLGL